MLDLTRAAETLGKRDFVDVPMRGPAEVRKVIDAFNDMQHRIMAMIADRTQPLAAVGHDFRMPLARPRLSADSVAHTSVAYELAPYTGATERLTASLLA